MLGGNTTVSLVLSFGACLPRATCAVGLVCPCSVITCATSHTRRAGAIAPSQRNTQSPKLAVVCSGVDATGGVFGASLEDCATAAIGTRHRARTNSRVTRIMNLTSQCRHGGKRLRRVVIAWLNAVRLLDHFNGEIFL